MVCKNDARVLFAWTDIKPNFNLTIASARISVAAVLRCRRREIKATKNVFYFHMQGSIVMSEEVQSSIWF